MHGRWLKQKPTTGHILGTLSHKWNMSITPLFSSLRDHHGGGRKGGKEKGREGGTTEIKDKRLSKDRARDSSYSHFQSVAFCAGLRAEVC